MLYQMLCDFRETDILKHQVSQLIWTPVDLDPRSISTSRYGPPGPNLLADMDPRGSKSTSEYGPPLADLDPPSKVKYM
jgi:hypothetical protein